SGRDSRPGRNALIVETEMHDVAVGDDILLALQPQLAGAARAGLTAQRNIVIICERPGADTTLLKVGMDDAGRGRAPGAAMDGPGTGFLRPDGEIGDEVEQLIAGADQPVETGFLKPQRLQEFRALLA